MPSAATTRLWKRAQGRRSSRAGTSVSMTGKATKRAVPLLSLWTLFMDRWPCPALNAGFDGLVPALYGAYLALYRAHWPSTAL